MKKNTSQEAFYQRLRNLADVNKASIKESQTRNLGTLIDFKKAADGVNYGIVKENHHYYIKKGGLKQNPDVSDFAYIGGLSNITNYQYQSLHEADKNRNMLLHTINEATHLKSNNNKLNEDKAGEEIDNAESKLDDLDAATAAAEEPASDEIAAGLESEPADEVPAADIDAGGAEEVSAEEPAGGGEELPNADGLPDLGDEEVPADGGEEAPEGDEEVPADGGAGGEEKDEATRELEKSIGKLTNTIRKTELTDSQVKSYMKSLIQSFKDKLPELEIEDRKEIANLILKVVPPEDMEDLGDSMPPEEVEEASCNECGSFAQYAESRGYGSADALMECGEEEVGNIVSGYANAHNDGMNDGDLEGVALVIKVVNPEMLDTLKNDYGHDEYAEKLTPYVDGMNESTEEENLAKLNELFGGLKSLTGAAKSKIGGAVQGAKQAVANKVQQGVQKVKDTGKAISQTYHSGEVAGEVQKLEKYANDLGAQVAALNTRLQKAGQPPVDTQKLIAGITNQLRGGKAASVAGTTAGAGLREEMVDPANVEVQPNIQEEENEIGFAPESQALGGAMVKPDGAPTTGVDINVSPDKTVNISMNEEKKPSSGMSKAEKSDLVKKAKKGEDIGKKGKGFEDVADKAAKEYGSKEKGEKVAAAAMWKNAAKNEGKEEMSESEIKIRKYIRQRLEEKAGLRKPMLNEDKKSETLKKLDKMIDEQYEGYKKVIKK